MVAPENTLSSFRSAAAAGARWVELDVALSADGVAVVFHDDRLERTSNGQGRLDQTSYAALSTLDAGAWFSDDFKDEPLPDLGRVLDLLVSLDLGLNLELKPDPDRADLVAEVVAGLLRTHWPRSRDRQILLSSFDPPTLAAAKARIGHLPFGVLIDEAETDWAAWAGQIQAVSVNLADRLATPQILGRIKAQGLTPVVWTVNDPLRAAALWRNGAVVITDDPAGLLAAVPGDK